MMSLWNFLSVRSIWDNFDQIKIDTCSCRARGFSSTCSCRARGFSSICSCRARGSSSTCSCRARRDSTKCRYAANSALCQSFVEQADGSQVDTTHGSHIGSHIAFSF